MYSVFKNNLFGRQIAKKDLAINTTITPVVQTIRTLEATSKTGSVAIGTYAEKTLQLGAVEQQAALKILGLTSAQRKEVAALTELSTALQRYSIQEIAGLVTKDKSKQQILATAIAKEFDKKTTDSLTQAEALHILTSKNLTKTQKEVLTNTLLQTDANKKETSSWGGLSGAMATTQGKMSLAMGLISAAVSIGVSIWKSYKQSIEEAMQAAKEAGDEYRSSAESVQDYKTRIAELKEQLDNGNLSEAEAYDVRKQLVGIQDSVIESLGNEAGAFDILKDSIDGVNTSLDNYLSGQAEANLVKNASTLEKAVSEMEKVRNWTEGSGAIGWSDINPEVTKRIEEIVDKYEFASLEYPSESESGGKWMVLNVTANAEDAEETFVGLANDFENLRKELAKEGIDLDEIFPSDSTWGEKFETYLSEVDEVINKYKENYDNYVTWTLASTPEYSSFMDQISAAKENLTDALAGDDEDAQEAAYQTLSNISNEIAGYDFGEDTGVQTYLTNLVNEIQSAHPEVGIKIALQSDRNMEAEVKDAIGHFLDDSGALDSALVANAAIQYDLGNVTEETQAYETLKDVMDEYGISVEDLCSILIDLGYANQIAADNSEPYKAKLQNLTDVLSELQTAYDALDSAEADMAGGSGLSPDTIDALADAEENYLDYLYEENGVVKLNTEAWKENANAKMMSEMDEIQKEIASLEERNDALRETIDLIQQQAANDPSDSSYQSDITGQIAEASREIEANTNAIAENQGKLAIYSSLYGSITGDLDAYTSALQNFSNVASTIDNITSSFQTLADLQAEVANGFTMSLEKAMEFAAVYPEILNSAQVTADGQITLNEGVVNSFIQGKKAELDAQIDGKIAQLEADKEVLQAKMDAAQAQMDLAKAIAEGEGDISKELAEYRINAGNIVAKTLIDAGIDEATAFKLAAAAMAQNAEEFDRVAAEVCTDVNGNFNQAAYNLAQTMYNNLSNVKTDLASVARQAHQTALAIAGIASGKVAGSAGIQSGSGGGSGGSGIKINLTDGRFDGTEYTYTAKESDLEDYISQIELDISKYQDAISQIDGQIAALRALKNQSLDNFKGQSGNGSGSGSGGGSSSSAKEVEEYVATLDDYREAVERLRKAQETRANIESKIENSDNLKEKILLERRLIDAYQREQEALHNLNNQRDSTIAAGVKALRELGFEVQYNADTNELWIENMELLNELTADSKGEYDTLQEATNALRQETEDLIDSLSDLNEENRESSENWKELKNDIKEARKQILELLDSIVEEASDAVDSIQNVYNTLRDAADEYAASGFITVDTLQSIIDLGQKYVSYLIDENGQLVINEDRIKAVIAARTQQLAIESSLTYVEALRIAKSEGDISTLNDLLYATEHATDATWGLVYANLALVGLSEDQYQDALRNINAIRALADSAVQSIGKTVGGVTDELEKMQTGLNDILGYVMDMLKQRVQDQIDGLEDMKDAYSEIIKLKKESLQASKDEADHQKSMASKMREIAKLQARIDLLSLDNSREAQAERAALLEELSELQSDLADEQADRALEAQEDALDEMEESYQAEKDKEIEALEDSISSYQKLYDMAIAYIESNWDTLYSELISWNSQYGDVLNSEIVSAWDNCLAAAQRYGSFVSALGSIEGDLQSSQSDGTNIQVGDTFNSEDMIHAIIKEMYENSKQYAYEDANGRLALNRRNLALGAELAQYGVTAVRGDDGVWYVDRVGGEKLYEKYKKYTYHKGGIVGGGDIKSNEQISLLKEKEWVLSEQMVKNLTVQMDRINMLADAMSGLPDYAGKSIMSDVDGQAGINKTINNITNNSRPIELRIGDTIIQGADRSTVEKHVKITRDMVNQIGRIIGIGR